ncbi:Cic1 protein [Saccharomycopsis crataegensis]|uniref:Cic1 protein n=1 Tax=Saccharomycopsis crataegensis TaxID=43959 RepID=A0AAV5QHG0_9ASCO|nr:Cic1 protein [Saccharomycopsis crataegensis]
MAPKRQTRSAAQKSASNTPVKAPKASTADKEGKTAGTPKKSAKSQPATPKQTPSKKADLSKKTPAKKTPAKKAETPKKTPAKAQTPKKTPTKKAQTPKKTPAKKAETSKKTPAKAQTPKSNNSSKTKSENTSALVSNKILQTAIDELIKFNERQSGEKEDENKQSLFDGEDDEALLKKELDVVIQFKKFLGSNPSLKPRLIKLNNSLYDTKNEALKICLIIRDDIIKTEDQLEKIEQANIPFLEKIIPVKELYKDHKTFDQKRQLWNSYDLFLADEGAITNLPAVLGKQFYGSSKIPVPVKIISSASLKNNTNQFSIETTKNQIQKVLDSTTYFVPVASNVRVSVGNISTNDKKQLVDNLSVILNHFETSKFNNGSENAIRSIFLKLRTSPALPLYYDKTLYLSKADIAGEESAEKTTKGEDQVETEKEYVVGSEAVIAKGVKLSKFEQGLLELGQFEEAPEFIEKKVKQNAKKEKMMQKLENKKRKAEQETEKEASVSKPKSKKKKTKA